MKYRGAFEVSFEIAIPSEAIHRVMAVDGDERDAVEFIARFCGIDRAPLNRFDGFADMSEDVSGVKVKYELTEWERVE